MGVSGGSCHGSLVRLFPTCVGIAAVIRRCRLLSDRFQPASRFVYHLPGNSAACVLPNSDSVKYENCELYVILRGYWEHSLSLPRTVQKAIKLCTRPVACVLRPEILVILLTSHRSPHTPFIELCYTKGSFLIIALYHSIAKKSYQPRPFLLLCLLPFSAHLYNWVIRTAFPPDARGRWQAFLRRRGCPRPNTYTKYFFKEAVNRQCLFKTLVGFEQTLFAVRWGSSCPLVLFIFAFIAFLLGCTFGSVWNLFMFRRHQLHHQWRNQLRPEAATSGC